MSKRARSTWLAPALSAGFAAGATGLGFGEFSGAAGAFGGYLGQKFKDITGYGDYNIRKNSLLSGTVPSVGNPTWTKNGLTISHKEYLGDVTTSSVAKTFAISDFILNPNSPQTWEWLSQIACNYEEWVPEGVLFYFKSTSGDALNSVDTSLGTVIMATNYNPYNKAFTTKAEMQGYEYSCSGPPSQDLIHMIECDPTEGSISTYYVSSVNQNAAASSSMDARFNTMGIFYIATTGFQGTSVNIGELWVTYQVTLLKPKLYQSLGLANDYIYIYNESNYNTVSATVGLFYLTNSRIHRQTMPFTGNTPSDKLWFEPSANAVTIHWPVFAFETYYTLIFWLQATAAHNPVFTITNSVGTGLEAPSQVGATHEGPYSAVTEHHMIRFTTRVPGGFICHDPYGTPSTRLSEDVNMVISNASYEIIQSPAIPFEPHVDYVA